MVGDEVLDSFAGKSKALRTIASGWSWTAPVWNSLISYYALRHQQNERFISGFSTVTNTTAAALAGPYTIDIKPLIGTKSFADFSAKPHSIQATVAAGPAAGTTVNATFNADKSQIILTFGAALAAGAAATVAWMVDTHPPTAPV
jgi:hypothetical protein